MLKKPPELRKCANPSQAVLYAGMRTYNAEDNLMDNPVDSIPAVKEGRLIESILISSIIPMCTHWTSSFFVVEHLLSAVKAE